MQLFNFPQDSAANKFVDSEGDFERRSLQEKKVARQKSRKRTILVEQDTKKS